MTTKELQKLNKLEKEVQVLKNLVANIVPVDTEGEYKDSFKKEMKAVSKEKSTFEYSGKGSLLKKLA